MKALGLGRYLAGQVSSKVESLQQSNAISFPYLLE